MRKHILYCSIITPTQCMFAKRVSEKYGSGSKDHAIVFAEKVATEFFQHQINFRLIGAAGNAYNSYIDRDKLKTAIDDEMLRRVLPYAMQSFDMLCRQYGYGANLAVLERSYLSGIRFWTAYLQHHQIDLVVFFTWPHEGNDYLLYQVCKALQIKTLIYGLSICPNRSYVIENIEDPLKFLCQRYKELCDQYRNCSLDEIQMDEGYAKLYEKMSNPKTDKTPYYMKKTWLDDVTISCYLSRFCTCYFYIQNQKKTHQLSDISWRIWFKAAVYKMALIDRHITKFFFTKVFLSVTSLHYMRNKRLWKRYKELSEEADLSKKYVYFPLHFQPECTSNPQGGLYYQQMLPVRILAESLPEDVYVYVKEHPTQVYGAREKGFYDELSAISNVILVKAETDTFELIKHSVAVATLTGTAGWEAVFHQKPCIMFGYWVTQHMPGVYHVRTKVECKNAVEQVLKGECRFTLKDVKLFFKALSETEGWRLEEEGKALTQEEMDHQISSNLKLFEQAIMAN